MRKIIFVIALLLFNQTLAQNDCLSQKKNYDYYQSQSDMAYNQINNIEIFFDKYGKNFYIGKMKTIDYLKMSVNDQMLAVCGESSKSNLDLMSKCMKIIDKISYNINQQMDLYDKIEPHRVSALNDYNVCLLKTTNDPLSGYQYYIKQLNINSAWNKVKNNNEVIVAIIDDGININHPDLVNSIWTNPNAKYGDSKIIDFVGDGLPANLPVGEHGTMISGIIGAKQNNNEGIAGIAKNVKFMPLRVFDSKGGAKEESIIKAMDYAINNGANIINLSLGLSQFYYSNKYDEIIKKAFDKGVVVVIAAGNGDILSGKDTGINLTNNPISPVCNNEGKYKYSIGVSASNEDGYRTNWTNYGNCAGFFAPGVGIVSTSIPVYNSTYGDNYNKSNGTSFSAPIITGIIALGYNQYGYINPIDIYDSLEESKVSFKLPDGQIGYKIDASKYIDILGVKLEKTINDNKLKQIKIDNENLQKQKATQIFNGIKTKLNKYSEVKRNKNYKSLLNQLKGIEPKVTGDKKIIVNELIILINKELGDDLNLEDLFKN